jgi:hypothetical protein
MTHKSTLAGTRFVFVALVALASFELGCGGGDECNIAAAHVVECVNTVGSPPSSTPVTTAKCDGETACIAACVNQTECAALANAYDGVKSAGADAFLACTAKCAVP